MATVYVLFYAFSFANYRALFSTFAIKVGPENTMFGTASIQAYRIPPTSLQKGLSLFPFKGKQSSIVDLVYVGNLGVPPNPYTGTCLSQSNAMIPPPIPLIAY